MPLGAAYRRTWLPIVRIVADSCVDLEEEPPVSPEKFP